ncbi:hypothetical protein DBR40_07445 [Pedobacter sp. KBW01]|uniref:DUF4238 domain-containing protein n=1 Tax=Pedobacter sp. KBW01 TaxID=2153364 RepID=UPI000F5AE196|nr:DUF4238 domain-containing protein [Pedobacter sp. KBW01]RQO77801.1 hypothetical protein DBR40_07445 [Pedobacter sp. KBW01]
MSRVKRQHYVPLFYLKGFSNEQSQVCVFDKTDFHTYCTNPINIGVEGQFYDQEQIDHKFGKQFIEKTLGDTETSFSILLQNLIEGIESRKIRAINEDTKLQICRYVALQAIRTKEQRQSMEQLFEMMKQKFQHSGWLSDEQIDQMGFNIGPAETRFIHNSQLLPYNKFAAELTGILMSHICLIFKNITDMPLITSDNPVAKKSNLNNEARSNSGFRSKGIEIMFPLSPGYLISFLERTHFKDLEQYENEVLVLTAPQHIIHYNSFQVKGSYRRLFSKNTDFELARKMITHDPNLGLENRERHRTG